jgi:hypothetical protein
MILTEGLFGAGDTRFVAVAQFLLILVWLVPGAHVLGLVLQGRSSSEPEAESPPPQGVRGPQTVSPSGPPTHGSSWLKQPETSVATFLHRALPISGEA